VNDLESFRDIDACRTEEFGTQVQQCGLILPAVLAVFLGAIG
jgi:hypothetical protein